MLERNQNQCKSWVSGRILEEEQRPRDPRAAPQVLNWTTRRTGGRQHSIATRSWALERDSWVQILALPLKATYLTSLGLGFLSCEVGVKLSSTSHRAASRIKCNNKSKASSTLSGTHSKCSVNVSYYLPSSCGKKIQTSVKINYKGAKEQVWAILLLLRKKRSKEVFLIPSPSTVCLWGDLGDKCGSQSSGADKRTQDSLMCVNGGASLPPRPVSCCRRPPCEDTSWWWRPAAPNQAHRRTL